MRSNVRLKQPPVFTHEGGTAYTHLTPLQQLRRSVLSCLLFEKEFYEDGASIADRIMENASKVGPAELGSLAIEARHTFNLRHAPLLLLCALIQKEGVPSNFVADTIYEVVSRADELAELLAVYWRNGRIPIDRQLRKGLARAITKFDEYQLAKWNRDGAIKLRDVLRIARPRPGRYRSGALQCGTDQELKTSQEALWGRAVRGELKTPDTWEVALSGGADKKATWERLIREDNLGYLALLRNLRNMMNAGVEPKLVSDAIIARRNGARRVLPFRYIAAARACPQLEPPLDVAMHAAIAELPEMDGNTIVLVDVSSSMDAKLAGKSDLTRMDAAAALGAIMPGNVRVFTFSYGLVEVPPRRGMAGVDAIITSQPHGGTYLGAALAKINQIGHNRLIVVTDEQTADRVPPPTARHAYMVNVASSHNGIGYGSPWIHFDGFSENILRFIVEGERAAVA